MPITTQAAEQQVPAQRTAAREAGGAPSTTRPRADRSAIDVPSGEASRRSSSGSRAASSSGSSRHSRSARRSASTPAVRNSDFTRRLLARNTARAERAQSPNGGRRAAAIVALLLGSAVTAFGVAPLTVTDPTPKVTRIVTEAVTVPGMSQQLETLDTRSLSLHRSDITRSTDTADTLLQRLGVNDPDMASFLRSHTLARRVLEGRPGKLVEAISETTPAGNRLQRLVVRGPAEQADKLNTHFTRLVVDRSISGVHVTTEQVPLVNEIKLGSATVDTSVFAAADAALIPDNITEQVVDLFDNEIDFRKELQRGDTFSVLYEQLTADGEPITWGTGTGRVVAARFVNAGHVHDAVWFQDGSRSGYYALDGQSKQRMFLATPVVFTRVTSGFALRFHPILKRWTKHNGVDLAAPKGTPVRVVGDGVVETAGVQTGYGNVIFVQHAGGRETVYAHLSRINVRRGQHVEQGQIIGLVGATGWATGPHLHFELRVDGTQVNPFTLARQAETALPVSTALRPEFDALAHSINVQLSTVAVADAVRME